MAGDDIEQTPFLKQLVDSDPEVRNKALSSLTKYLTSGRTFTDTELLKLWRGLYYSLYHTPLQRSQPLLRSLVSLQLSVPVALSLPFARTFWRTIATLTPQLDANRIDKFLALERRMLNAQLLALGRRGWPAADAQSWIAMMGDRTDGPLGLGGQGEKVGDGVRYHVLDVLLDELVGVHDEVDAGVPLEVTVGIQDLVRKLAERGRGAGVRKSAGEVLADERWREIGALSTAEGGERGEGGDDGGSDEWSGIQD